MTTALFDAYRRGIAALIVGMGRRHPKRATVYLLQQRLLENLDQAATYGDTPALQAQRAQVLAQLDRLSQMLVGKPFDELCPP